MAPGTKLLEAFLAKLETKWPKALANYDAACSGVHLYTKLQFWSRDTYTVNV